MSANQKAGLIQSGVDTIQLPREWGFDFVTATQCTIPSATYRDCVHHFVFTWNAGGDYRFFIGWYQRGFGLNLGKINLDSIKTAPPDSIIQRQGGYTMDSIPPNGLASRIGNVYVMKTGTDPRPFWNVPFYAKIKILKFITHDTATHNIDMVFLWACQPQGTPELTTTGLDTFRLGPVSASPAVMRNYSTTSKLAPRSALKLGQHGLVVSGERGIWSLDGRRLDRAANQMLNHTNRYTR